HRRIRRVDAERRQLRGRTADVRLRLLVVGVDLRRLLLGHGALGLELLRALERFRGDFEVVLGLERLRLEQADLRRRQLYQRLARVHVVADLHADLLHAAVDRRRDALRAVLIEGYAPGEPQLRGRVGGRDRVDADVASLGVVGRELEV